MQEYDESPNLTSWGTKMSLLGHIAVFVGAVVWAYVGGLFDFSKQDEPPVFELVPFVEKQAKQETSKPQTQPQQIKVKQIQDLQPLDIPPEPEPEPEPQPQPQPPQPDPRPQPQPTVSESNSAKQTPKSYADFLKENGKKIEERGKSKPKPRPRNVKINNVKVNSDNFKVVLSGASSSNAGGATQNELQAYYAEIYRILKSNWVMPDDCAGMDLVVKISLTISERGKSSNVRLVKSSGAKSFDDSALRLFKIVSFPIPPRAKPLSLTIDFKAD